MTRATTHPATKSRSRIRRIAAVTCVVALGLGVGAAQAQPAHSPQNTTSPMHLAPAFQGPPPLQLTNGSITLSLSPYTSCWTHGNVTGCSDGAPLQPLASLGGTYGPIHLAFPRDGWHFNVSVVGADGHRTKIRLIAVDARHWRLDLADLPDGRYRVDIFGRGPQGDVAAAAAFTLI